MRRALLTVAATAALLAPFVPAGADEPIEDLVPPKIFIIRQAGHVNGWYASAASVNIRATDDHPFASGVRIVSYTMTGANTGQGTVDRLAGGDVAISGARGQTEIVVEAIDGNDNDAFGMTTVGVDPDAPTISLPGRLQQGALFAQGEAVTVEYACADALSGVRSCTGMQPAGSSLDTSTVGEHAFSITAADNVGRTSVRTLTYRVADARIQLVRDVGMPARAQVGQAITPSAPQFTPEPESITYRWTRNGTPIPGATSLTYVPTPEDANRALSLIATARRAGFQNGSTTSRFVQVDPAPIVITSEPVLEGEAAYGGWLTVEYGQITPATATVEHQWLRDGVLVPEASGRQFWPGIDDVGHRISARVVAQAPGHETRTWVTPASPPVQGKIFQVSGATSIRGETRVGAVVTASPATFNPAPIPFAPADWVTLSYSWLRDGRPITGATAATYRLQPADAGHRISVAVTGTAPGYEPAVSTSAAGPPVLKAIPVVKGRLMALGNRKARLTVTVAVPGVQPTGKVTVKRGSKVVARAANLRRGRRVVTLKNQARGKAKYVVLYAGAPGIAPGRVMVSGRIR